MKRSGEPLENDEKNKPYRRLDVQGRQQVWEEKIAEVIANGRKILPSKVFKYTGSVNFRGDNKLSPWRSTFTSKLRIAGDHHRTREEAEIRLKEENVSRNLKITNIIYEYENAYYCLLTKGQVMKFDIEDLDLVENYVWHAQLRACTGFHDAYTNIQGKKKRHTAFTHMVFPNLKENESVDHKNRMPLDNSRLNIRPVRKIIQAMNQGLKSNNTSTVIGVSLDTTGKYWKAQWEDERKHNKMFSISKHGENAFLLACAHRKEMEDTLPTYREALCK